MPWACRSSPPPATMTAGSTCSSSAIRGRSRRSTTSGRSFCGTHLDQPGVFHRRVKKVVVTADATDPGPDRRRPGGLRASRGSRPRRPSCDGQRRRFARPRADRPGWTVEILPAALEIHRSRKRRTAAAHRVPLANGRTAAIRCRGQRSRATARSTRGTSRWSRLTASRSATRKEARMAPPNPVKVGPVEIGRDRPAGPDRRSLRDGAGRHDAADRAAAGRDLRATCAFRSSSRPRSTRPTGRPGRAFAGRGWSRA